MNSGIDDKLGEILENYGIYKFKVNLYSGIFLRINRDRKTKTERNNNLSSPSISIFIPR